MSEAVTSTPRQYKLHYRGHGGQILIPFLNKGVYAPDQGLFPRYAGGRYELDGTVMIVSRGLARESTRVPRFYNRPELVMIELKP